jgi:AraC-like DNA-binding protein
MMADVSDALILTAPTATGVASYPPGATYGPRAMRDFEFVWLMEGDAQYQRGEQTVEAPAGSIVLCRPGETDFFRWDTERSTRHGFFHFDILQLPDSWPTSGSWPLVRLTPEGDILRPMFRHLLTWSSTGDPALSQLTMKHMLTAFVLGQLETRELPREPLPDAVERALAYVEKEFAADPSTPITLADLASSAGVTPEHLCRLFSASTGRSPAETVRFARLDRAALLLARSNFSINEIATMCGFASPFHFSRRFKEAFGQSPRGLRQLVRHGGAPPTPRLLKFWRTDV